MSKIVTIAIDDETLSHLEQKRKEDPHFNFSAFVREKLKENQLKQDNPEEFKLNIENKKAQIMLLKNEVDFLEEKHRKILLEKELEKKKEEENEIKKKEMQQHKLNFFADNLMYFFKDISLADALNYAHDYYEMPPSEQKGVINYGIFLGLVQKPKEEMIREMNIEK